MKHVFFKTFGCRTNLFDTQVMAQNLQDFHRVFSENEADIIVVNSCTVTNSADSNVRLYINRIKREYPEKPHYLTGCGVQTKGESLFNLGGLFGVFGHSEKEQIGSLLKRENRFFEIGDLVHLDKTIVEDFAGKSRAFIKIQEGCNFRCSYCIIPYVRGNSRSYDESIILKQVKRLVENGYGEFILTGTNIGSYGTQGSASLATLLQKMSQIRGLRRIRLGSIEPIQITKAFKELLNEPWMARHLHIALQHTTDKMLKVMNRRNRLKSDLALFEEIASYGYALGTDFIIGHPGESETIWREAVQNISKFPLTHLHAFTYSKRDGTPSAEMKPEVNGNIAKERHTELSALIDEKNYRFRDANKKEALELLIENKNGNIYSGYDQFFNTVHANSPHDISGDWVSVNSYKIEREGTFATYK